MFALFGSITLGVSHLTGPTKQGDRYRNAYARHDVIRGKPVLQVIGQELDERTLEFFFDETFCNPVSEWARLEAAFQAREAQPFVASGVADGRRYVVNELSRDVLKTTRAGAVVRLSSAMTLIESPVADLLASTLSSIRAAAPGIGRPEAKPAARK